MKATTRDNLIYLAVGGIIAAAATFYVFFTDRTMGRIPDIPTPLVWGILSTPAIGGLILERFWKHRRRATLWIILAGTAAINAAAMFTAYRFRWDPPLLTLSLTTGLGLVAVFVVIERALSYGTNSKRDGTAF